MFFLDSLFNLIYILNSKKGAWAISSGFCLGMWLGFIPVNVFYLAAAFVCVFLLSINGSAFLLSYGVFKIFSYVLDPLFDRLGYFFLVDAQSLKSFWTTLYNLPIVPWTNFNHTIVNGGFFAGAILFLPSAILLNYLVKKYRSSVLVWLNKTPLVKAIKANKMYEMYESFVSIKEKVL